MSIISPYTLYLNLSVVDLCHQTIHDSSDKLISTSTFKFVYINLVLDWRYMPKAQTTADPLSFYSKRCPIFDTSGPKGFS